MKISDLKDMTVEQILSKLDLSEAFLDDLKVWCRNKPSDPKAIISSFHGMYANNPFLDILKKEDK